LILKELMPKWQQLQLTLYFSSLCSSPRGWFTSLFN
jgi:hypothetical protein